MIDINFIMNGKRKKPKKFKDPIRDLMIKPKGNIIGDRITKPQRKVLKKKNAIMRFADWDGDGVINGLDCAPKNKKKHMAIRFGRKPNNMPRDMWEEQQQILNKITHKNNPNMDPRVKMNTILTHDKYMKQHQKVHPIHRDENWQRDVNEDSIHSLKEQGYSEDDAREFITEKNKRKMETANYFAQELARDEKVGHMFKGAIPERPISEEEGARRYKELEKYDRSISLGSVQRIKPERTEEDDMYDFMQKQEEEESKYYSSLKNKPKSEWSENDKEFYDAYREERGFK